MDSGTVAAIILVAIIIAIVIFAFRFVSFLGRRACRNMLRGNLREDYIRNYPDSVERQQAFCRKCGCRRIFVKDIGDTRNIGPDKVREHVCSQCGLRLYYSVSGSSMEKIVEELKQEAFNQAESKAR